MSEQAPERTARKPAAGSQKKILGLPRNVAIAALAGVVALAFLWWRSRSSGSGSGTAGQACTDANGNPGTFDSSGNCVTSEAQTSQTDLSGEPCTDADGNPGLTDALGNCLASQQLSTATGSTGTTGTTTATGTGTTTSTGTTTTTGTTTAAVSKPGAVTGLTVGVNSPTEVSVSWRPPQFASHAPTSTTYNIQVTPKDKAAHNIGSRTSYNVGGLKKNTAYVVHVSATNSAGTGPVATKSFRTKA